MAKIAVMVAVGEQCSSSRPVRCAKAQPAERIPVCIEPPAPFVEGPGQRRDWWEKALSEKSCSGPKRGKPLQNQGVGARSRTSTEGPFGELLRQTGPMAKANPFRFSTKYQDNESDLIYYGYRYYDPSTGRWLSRDPIEEDGGINLYEFACDNPVSTWDQLGLSVWGNPVRGPGGIVTPSPSPTVNEESLNALSCFWNNGESQLNYGPQDPWTKQMAAHPHLDDVRREIKLNMQEICDGHGGAFNREDDFNQQNLPSWDKWAGAMSDLLSWMTWGKHGTNPAYRFGSFRLHWSATPYCCCRVAIVKFDVSDIIHVESMVRNPGSSAGKPILPIGDNPFGPNGPFHDVHLAWNWTETLTF